MRRAGEFMPFYSAGPPGNAAECGRPLKRMRRGGGKCGSPWKLQLYGFGGMFGVPILPRGEKFPIAHDVPSVTPRTVPSVTQGTLLDGKIYQYVARKLNWCDPTTSRGYKMFVLSQIMTF